MAFLFTNINEFEGDLDFIIISGDAYVDHPSFGHAVIGRFMQSLGYKVGIIPQPQNDEDYKKLGVPKISFMISSGVVDSMVNNYTASKKKRTNDEYSPNNKGFVRPDRALIVYSKNLKRLFPDSFIIAGGVEASLRRFAHYDYWSNSIMPSVAQDANCDLIIYGAGEKPLFDIDERLKKGIPISSIKDVDGTCYMSSYDKIPKRIKESMTGERKEYIQIKSFNEIKDNKIEYAKTFKIQSENCDYLSAKGMIQEQRNKEFLIQNPPQRPLTQEEMDYVYALPYEREYHPMYKSQNGIKALEEVKFSITSHRGCFGGCSFCSITYHMGRAIQNRSKESIVKEAEIISNMPDFKGYIHDIGGPSANFRDVACDKQKKYGVCPKGQCIGDKPCPNLKVDHSEYLDILRTVRKLPRIKKVFIRSGVRFDYVMMDKNDEFMREMVKYHVSGQLKTAPEHVSPKVLKLMNKPEHSVYEKFCDKFDFLTKKYGLKQYIVPYFISSHPGSDLNDAVELAKYLKSINYMPLQVQDFYPTPSTRSTVMYYTGIDPETMEEVHVPNEEERRMQRALLQYRKKENQELVRKALMITGNKNLIGYSKECLVTPVQRINKTNFKNKRK